MLVVTISLIPSVLLSRSFPSRFEMTAMVRYPLLSSRELDVISDSRICGSKTQAGQTLIQSLSYLENKVSHF